MTVRELLEEKGRIACVHIRNVNSNENYYLYSDSPKEFSKKGYVDDTCNTISIQEIMNLRVSGYYVPDGCNSIIIKI